MIRRLLAAALGLWFVAVILAPSGASAQSVEEFYKKNNVITFYTGFGPGTGYDIWARAVSIHMTKVLPGNPTFIIKNMPGAGSLTLANYLYNNAPKDGTAIGMFSRNIPSQVMLGLDNAQLDPREFTWIGSPESSIRVCAVMPSTGVTKVEDLMTKEVPMGGSGGASTFMPTTINQAAGTKFKVIKGYQSAGEIYLAMQRGEVGGMCGTYESISRDAAEMIKDGKLKILFNTEAKRSALLKGAPSIQEYIKDARNKQLLDFINSATELGRPIAAPPQLPADRAAALRKAFMTATSDPAFLADAQKQGLEVDVLPGEDIQELVKNLYRIPKDIVDEATKLMGEK
jgi:tripartite-type tricarboxylate transporter receptor subunit TctC